MDAPSATTLALPSTPEAGALARQAVRALCSEAQLAEDACDVALLLVTELVSNAVRHAGAAPVLDVELLGDAIRIAVRDPSPTLPRAVGAPDDLIERGRACSSWSRSRRAGAPSRARTARPSGARSSWPARPAWPRSS